MLAEYTAEGVTAPLLTVRKGPHKRITSPEDPLPLFDLDADPDETRNLAGDPGAAGIWDMPALDRPARESQAARRLAAGARSPWDYQPVRDASKTYYREPGDVQDAYSGRLRR